MKKLFSILSILVCAVSLYGNRPHLHIATYNLRMNTPSDSINAWPNRKEAVKSLVRFHEFDVFGTQEGFRDQLEDLSEMQEYHFAGCGRDDGHIAGEHSAIFYRHDRFSLLDKGDFWLSETPDIPSFGWDANSHKRLCSWVKLYDRQNCVTFYVFNAHYDHRGQEARRESSKLILRKISEIADQSPVFFMGDLNAGPENEAVVILNKVFADAYNHSEEPPYGPLGTFNDFDINRPLTDRIDYIFVNGRVRVIKYGVLSDSNHQRYPSDHLPVMIKAEFLP